MILKYGSKGKEVKELQEFLSISPDGHFGKETEGAVKTWQANNKLTADGIVARHGGLAARVLKGHSPNGREICSGEWKGRRGEGKMI